jgi:hypothetical protein
MTRENLGSGVLEYEVTITAQMWLNINQTLTSVGMCRNRAHVKLGVSSEQAKNLATGVTAGSSNGNRVCH